MTDPFPTAANSTRLETKLFRVYQDPDGYDITEVLFSDGSTALMHLNQFNAISIAAVRTPEWFKFLYGEGPEPKVKPRTPQPRITKGSKTANKPIDRV